jgi:hypothetical protein
VDVSAGSKVLISTRIKALLAGGHEVEVGLPSAADSVRMLLSAADVEDNFCVPKGVSEIVDLCGRLPLALAIAGRLAASLDLVGMDDWTGMIDVLREELHESHSGGTEAGMIAASLRGLKGSAREQANVKSLLLLYALCPEDTHMPLEVLLLMFEAVNDGPRASMMHIRKWLRILINRSLVLGTIDRPSVHDLVLDFAVAQHSDSDLQLKQRACVEAFRAARPADAHGRRKYDAAQKDDPITVYVCREIEYHVSSGWQVDMEHDELAIKFWLADVPQDEVAVAAGRVLGSERLSKLAVAAETSEDWWLAARYWAVVQSVIRVQLGGSTAGVEPTVKAIECMARLKEEDFSPDNEDFQLAQVGALAGAFDISGDLARRPEMVQRALKMQATTRDPLYVGSIRFIVDTMPGMMSGDTESVGRATLDTILFLLKAGQSDPDPVMRAKCLAFAYNFSQVTEPMFLQEKFSWDAVYGPMGGSIQAAFDTYEYDTMHAFLTKSLLADWFIAWATPCLPLALHWGNMKLVNANFDKAMVYLRRMIQEPNYDQECAAILCGAGVWSHLIWSCRMSAEQRDSMHNVLASCQLTWATADGTIDRAASKMLWMRPRGDRENSSDLGADGGNVHSAEAFSINIKCMSLLMKRGRETDEEIMLSLPSVDEIIPAVVTAPETGVVFHTTHISWNVFVACGAVCETIGRLRRGPSAIIPLQSPLYGESL